MSSSETSPWGPAISADSSAIGLVGELLFQLLGEVEELLLVGEQVRLLDDRRLRRRRRFALAGAAHLVLEEVSELLVGDELGVDGRERLRRRELLDGRRRPRLPRRELDGVVEDGRRAELPRRCGGLPDVELVELRFETGTEAGGDERSRRCRLGLRARETGAREDAPPVLEAPGVPVRRGERLRFAAERGVVRLDQKLDQTLARLEEVGPPPHQGEQPFDRLVGEAVPREDLGFDDQRLDLLVLAFGRGRRGRGRRRDRSGSRRRRRGSRRRRRRLDRLRPLRSMRPSAAARESRPSPRGRGRAPGIRAPPPPPEGPETPAPPPGASRYP